MNIRANGILVLLFSFGVGVLVQERVGRTFAPIADSLERVPAEVWAGDSSLIWLVDGALLSACSDFTYYVRMAERKADPLLPIPRTTIVTDSVDEYTRHLALLGDIDVVVVSAKLPITRAAVLLFRQHPNGRPADPVFTVVSARSAIALPDSVETRLDEFFAHFYMMDESPGTIISD